MKTFNLIKQIIEARIPGGTGNINSLIEEFQSQIESENDVAELIQCIKYDNQYLLIPYHLYKAIFNRLFSLGERTSYTLKNAAFIIELFDESAAAQMKIERLRKEAEELENIQ